MTAACSWNSKQASLGIRPDGVGMGHAQRAQALSVLVPPEDSPPSAAAPSPDLAPVDAPVAPVDLSAAIFAAVDPNPECAPGPPCLHAGFNGMCVSMCLHAGPVSLLATQKARVSCQSPKGTVLCLFVRQ